MMISADHSLASYRRETKPLVWGRASARRIVVLALGGALMAASGGGLAGYLNLSSATAAPVSQDAAPLN